MEAFLQSSRLGDSVSLLLNSIFLWDVVHVMSICRCGLIVKVCLVFQLLLFWFVSPIYFGKEIGMAAFL